MKQNMYKIVILTALIIAPSTSFSANYRPSCRQTCKEAMTISIITGASIMGAGTLAVMLGAGPSIMPTLLGVSAGVGMFTAGKIVDSYYKKDRN